MERVLVVEDEPGIAGGLVDLLESQGYRVDLARTGGEAVSRVAVGCYELVLLDLRLPEISGEDLCRRWRREGLTTPIIMLTAKGSVAERVAGLELGADDYLPKPFDPEELLARARAVLRRSDPVRRVAETLPFAGCHVDFARREVVGPDGAATPLTQMEASLIRYFAAHPGRILSRAELYQRVWGETLQVVDTRTVDVHVARLRSKLGEPAASGHHLRTVRGEGYLYDPPAAGEEG
ncbi:MAG: response regulator transcription factor [Planctomycetes bacterium]|nr:response regulator transcription factor [Planctomycetota bacterium]